jgi:cytoskeletal protein CcmA (bactofilin family)
MRDRASGPTTIIAEGCSIEGRLTCDGDLLVCGEVVGDSNLDCLVTIARSGRWHGKLRARNLVVSGTILGDVIALEKIEIAATARIEGTVTGDVIAVAEGAVIDGEMQVSGRHNRAQPFIEKRAGAAPSEQPAKAG